MARSAFRRRLTGLTVVPLLLLGACAGEDALDADSGDGGDSGNGGEAKGEVVIGGQNYTEMQIMSEVYKQVLENAGYDVTVQLVESRAVYTPEMQRGNVDVSADYLSSMTNYLNAEENGPDAPLVATPDADETVEKLRELAEPTGIEPLEPAEAENANAFFVTSEFAEENDLSTLSDLAELDEPVTLAAAEDCSERPDCKIGLEETYGLQITKVEPLGYATTQTKEAVKSGEVTLGQTGTSDATLEQDGLVLLEDDKNLQNAENLVPMVNSEFIEANSEVADLLNEMSSGLSTEELAEMIGKVDLERRTPEEVANDYLSGEGLI